VWPCMARPSPRPPGPPRARGCLTAGPRPQCSPAPRPPARGPSRPRPRSPLRRPRAASPAAADGRTSCRTTCSGVRRGGPGLSRARTEARCGRVRMPVPHTWHLRVPPLQYGAPAYGTCAAAAGVLGRMPPAYLRVARLVCRGWAAAAGRLMSRLQPERLQGGRLAARFPHLRALCLSHCGHRVVAIERCGAGCRPPCRGGRRSRVMHRGRCHACGCAAHQGARGRACKAADQAADGMLTAAAARPAGTSCGCRARWATARWRRSRS
jgi:hypothetical protein